MKIKFLKTLSERDYWSITNLGHGLKRETLLLTVNYWITSATYPAERSGTLSWSERYRQILSHSNFRLANSSSLSVEITQLIGAGLAERHIQEYTSHRENLRRHDSPIVLTSDHSEAGFLALIGFRSSFHLLGEFLPTRRLFQNKTRNLLRACAGVFQKSPRDIHKTKTFVITIS